MEFRPGLDVEGLRKEFGIGPDDPVILNVAMIRKDKGQQDFLAAFLLVKKEQPDCKFILLGEGTGDRALEKKLRRQIEQLGFTDRFLMPGYRTDVAAFMNLATIVAVTSTRFEAESLTAFAIRIVNSALWDGKRFVREIIVEIEQDGLIRRLRLLGIGNHGQIIRRTRPRRNRNFRAAASPERKRHAECERSEHSSFPPERLKFSSANWTSWVGAHRIFW